MGSWPEDKVTSLYYSQVSGVKEDGRTIVFDALEEDEPVEDAEDVSIVIFCTGYEANLDFVEDKLLPWTDDDEGVWSMEDMDQKDWQMTDNVLTEVLGHVEPSDELEANTDYVHERMWGRLLISNPNMMYLLEWGEYPLLEIDISAWLCLAYITGGKEIPTKDQMLEANRLDLLNGMQDMSTRYDMDENYKEAWDALPDDHGINDPLSSEFMANEFEFTSCLVRRIARDMVDASYPLQLGTIDELNKTGEKLVYMACRDSLNRYELENCDEDTKRWKTFRDMDPSPFSSLITGTKSVPLKGKWLEIDDEGNNGI